MIQKDSFIKKNVDSHKIKSGKKHYHKKCQLEVFQVCVSLVYDSFILELSITLQCYCGYNVKYGLLSKTCLKKNDNKSIDKKRKKTIEKISQ